MALLVPCWQIIILCTCRAGCLDNVVLYSSVDVLKGWLDSFSFWLPQCWGVPVMQSGVFPQLLLVLSTFVLGGGGSVTIEGFVLYAGGVYTLILCYLCKYGLRDVRHVCHR